MAFVLFDRVREYSDTNGTGAIHVTGVVSGGYQTFDSVLSNGDTTLVCCRNAAGQWQTFLATWDSATQTLARTTPYEGSDGEGVNVGFSGESQEVWINYPAEKYERPSFRNLHVSPTYATNSGVRLATIYGDQSLSAGSYTVFRLGGITRGTISGNVEGVYSFLFDEDRLRFSDPSEGALLVYNGATLRAGWSGGRTLAMDQLYVGNPSAPGTGSEGTSGEGAYHVAGASFAYSYTNAGGAPGAERGNLFGRNDAVRVLTGSGPHWNSAFGHEIDVGVEAEQMALWKGGLKVVQWSTDRVRGLIQDYAFGINNQAHTSTPGWRHGFALGGFEGYWPFRTDSTIMGKINANGGAGNSPAAGAGINLRDITFGESAFASDGFRVDGSGNLGALTASGVALQTRSGINAKTAVVNTITVIDRGLFISPVTLTLTAPTTSGTTATATVATYTMEAAGGITTGGIDYAVGDTITVSGGTSSVAATGVVTHITDTGGVVGLRITNAGTNSYSALPSNPVSTTTSGAGTGFTFTPLTGVLTVTVSGAGTNYSEHLPPTVSSSGSTTYRQAVFAVSMTASAAPLALGTNLSSYINIENDLVKVSGANGAIVRVSTSGTKDYVAYSSGVIFDARMYGAVGDGSTDDTSALSSALTAAAAAGGFLYLPNGTYIAEGLTIPSGLKGLIGDANDITILKRPNSGVASSILAATSRSDFTISDIGFDGNKANQTIGAANIRFTTCSDFKLIRLRNINAKAASGYGEGIVIATTPSTNTTGREVLIEDCEAYENDSHGLSLTGTGTGITVDAGVYSYNTGAGISFIPTDGTADVASNIKISDVRAEYNGGSGISLAGFIQADGNYGNTAQPIQGAIVSGCQVNYNTGYGVIMQVNGGVVDGCAIRHNGATTKAGVLVNAINVKVTGCTITHNETWGLDLGGAENTQVIGNTISFNVGHGMNVGGCRQITIAMNILEDNGSGGIIINRWDGGSAGGFPYASIGTTVDNNRFINTLGASVFGVACDNYPKNVTITNNRFVWPDTTGYHCIRDAAETGYVRGNAIERGGSTMMSFTQNGSTNLTLPDWCDEVLVNTSTAISSLVSYSRLQTFGTVLYVELTSPGSGYTSDPTVSATGGGGSGATFTAARKQDGTIAFVRCTAGGSGYTSAPTLSFSGGGGSGAAATAVLGMSNLIRGRQIAFSALGSTINFVSGTGIVLPVATGETLSLPSGSRIAFMLTTDSWEASSVVVHGGPLRAESVQLTGGLLVLTGAGTPESAVTAPVGSVYMRTDGGASTSLYVKESGAGNTGWVAK